MKRTATALFFLFSSVVLGLPTPSTNGTSNSTTTGQYATSVLVFDPSKGLALSDISSLSDQYYLQNILSECLTADKTTTTGCPAAGGDSSAVFLADCTKPNCLQPFLIDNLNFIDVLDDYFYLLPVKDSVASNSTATSIDTSATSIDISTPTTTSIDSSTSTTTSVDISTSTTTSVDTSSTTTVTPSPSSGRQQNISENPKDRNTLCSRNTRIILQSPPVRKTPNPNPRTIDKNTLQSIYYQTSLEYLLKNIHKHKPKANQYHATLEKTVDIVALSKSVKLPMVPLCRLVLQYVCEQKTVAQRWIKNPDLIECEWLRRCVRDALERDSLFSLLADARRHVSGIACEKKLVECLEERGLDHLDENDLRNDGFTKTPDIHLTIPIGVNGQVIQWIESKGGFGDLKTHASLLEGQYFAYVQRYGPGLVIYWGGHVKEIESANGILVMADFPTDITKFESEFE